MNTEHKNHLDKVWFVTGASKGLGLAITQTLLASGYKVVATSRSRNDLIHAIGNQNDRFLPLEVDLVNEQSVQKAVNEALKVFNHIDVVVNNAGYGQFGTVEEVSDKEARQNYDVNVFGTLNVIRRVMPHLREQGSGHIFNISSIGGFVGNYSGWGIYCSTKFAVAGLTEALHTDVKPFGIHVTLVYPGYFRTNFLDKDSIVVPHNPIDQYEEARKSQEIHIGTIRGQQIGDPEKAALALIQVANSEHPPLHLFLGTDTIEGAKEKIKSLEHDIMTWEELTNSTDLK